MMKRLATGVIDVVGSTRPAKWQPTEIPLTFMISLDCESSHCKFCSLLVFDNEHVLDTDAKATEEGTLKRRSTQACWSFTWKQTQG